MFYLMGYNHSMSEREAGERDLPEELHVTLSEERADGPKGDIFQPWQAARNLEALPPRHLFLTTSLPAWTVDIFTSHGGAIVSERFLALLQTVCGNDIHVSRVTIIDGKDRDSEEQTYFVKFLAAVDALDAGRLDFGGARHDIIGGSNTVSVDGQGQPLVRRAAGIAFLDDKPEVFLERSLPELALPLFCSGRFKAKCEQDGMRGPWFWPETDLLVVDFAPAWGDQFKKAAPQLVTRDQRARWPARVDRENFFDPAKVELSPEHLAILRASRERKHS